ncbi:MAG: flippase-like domain-containing protein [Sphingomonadales bacterium]|nr:flippase-like domain-containing protein [Sphingomonadales bacterium]
MARGAARSMGWLALAAALFAALFVALGFTPGDVGRALLATPGWLFATVVATTFANQLIGASRWRTAAVWLSPDAARLRFHDMLEATVWGSLLGQLMPMQLSLSLGRLWHAREARGGWVVGTTLYEQMFDLVVLSAGGAGALLVLLLGASPAASLAVALGAVIAGCVAIHQLFAIGHVFARKLGASALPGARHAARLVEPLARARSAPPLTVATLAAWSVARLPVLALRSTVVAIVFAQGADWLTVVIGYPAIGLASAMPILPGGMGVTEWTWTGLLVLAGATASAAGIAAVVMRIVNLVALVLVLLLVLALRLLHPRAAAASLAPSR